MSDARREQKAENERLRHRAVELGNALDYGSSKELISLVQHTSPAVRRAAASALAKLIARFPDLGGLAAFQLHLAIPKEDHPQTLQYILRALEKCSRYVDKVMREDLLDLSRNPNYPDYVRAAANDALAAAENAQRHGRALCRDHWCSRCGQPISPEQSQLSTAKLYKPYCRHCQHERELEAVNFEATVESAKRLRTSDGTAVQSKGEKIIGDWLGKRNIAYVYDERLLFVQGDMVRPDFYLPEYDIYIEYWGMDTPEYNASMFRKKFLYQRAGKRLVSFSWRELDRLESALSEKLVPLLHL